MSKFAIFLTCLAYAGHAREPSQLAKLLLALEPSHGFKASSPGAMNRRDLLARASAGLAGLTAAQAASAKQGEFSGVDFSSTESGSLPYRGGSAPLNQNEDGGAGFGFALVEGQPITKGFRKDLKCAKIDFEVSEEIFRALKVYVDAKEWFTAGDDLRSQVYTFRTSMKQITDYGPKEGKDTKKAYTAFWSQIGALDVAFRNKDPERSTKAYARALELLETWKKVAL